MSCQRRPKVWNLRWKMPIYISLRRRVKHNEIFFSLSCGAGTAFSQPADMGGAWYYRGGAGSGIYVLLPSFRIAEQYGSCQSCTGRFTGRRSDFALLTVLELDRVHSSHTDVLTDSMISPLAAEVCRTLALLTAASAAAAAAMIIWMPVTASLTGAVFRPGLCAAVYLLVMLPSLWFSILSQPLFISLYKDWI